MTTPQINWKFSPSTLEMYFLGVHDADRLPADCVDVTDERRAELADEMAGGKVFGADAGGKPIAVDAPPRPAAERWALRQRLAKLELTENDKVLMRCGKAGVPYPPEWMAYDEALRAIVRASTGDPDAAMPSRPAYPAGT